MMQEAEEAVWDSARYLALLALREKVLREPLGLTLSTADRAQDLVHRHFGIWESDGTAGACAVVVPLSPEVWKIRQMAVAASLRGQGLGRRVVERVTAVALSAGVQRLVLHAREPAMPFYERLGFQAEGERFQEVGLPHFLMKKELSSHG